MRIDNITNLFAHETLLFLMLLHDLFQFFLIVFLCWVSQSHFNGLFLLLQFEFLLGIQNFSWTHQTTHLIPIVLDWLLCPFWKRCFNLRFWTCRTIANLMLFFLGHGFVQDPDHIRSAHKQTDFILEEGFPEILMTVHLLDTFLHKCSFTM